MNEKVYIYGINSVSDVLKHKPEQVIEVFLVDDISNKRFNKLIDLTQQHQILLMRANLLSVFKVFQLYFTIYKESDITN